MESKSVKVIRIENTPVGWAKLSKESEALEVRTAIKGTLDERQLFCLRYCFIELDRQKQKCPDFSLKALVIKVEKEDDAYRIQSYLSVMTALRDVRLKIFHREGVVFGLHDLFVDYYRILPLFCVGVEKEKWMTQYSTLIEPWNRGDIRDLIEQGFQEGARTLQEENDWTSGLLKWLCLCNLRHMQDEISGSEGNAMSRQEKMSLFDELLSYLGRELPCLGLLACLIWLIFLRSFVDSKDLFYRSSDKKWHMDMETLRCTRLDALSYAEGILQLMENACIHSEMRCSYVSVRISDVNIMSKGPVRVYEAAEKRLEILQRYGQTWSMQNDQGKETGKEKKTGKETGKETGKGKEKETFPEYILDKQTKYCLEFSVLNDARRDSGQSAEELWGITRTFAYNRKKEDWEKMTLRDVFSYQCEDSEDIAKHYGLRLLEKTVQLNGGVFSVFSPGADGMQTRYSSFYHTKVKTACYQIKSQETCTEFNVLLPIYPHWHDVQEAPEKSTPPEGLFQKDYLDREAPQQRILCLRTDGVLTFDEANMLLPPKPLFGQMYDHTGGEWRKRFQVKQELIEKLWNSLDGYSSSKNKILLLDLMNICDFVTLEIVAKSIFYLITRRSKEGTRVLLAVLLPNEVFISEFVRIFSIFYDKQLSDAHWMGESQIVLCGYQEENREQFPRGFFLLAGSNSSSARSTARTFAYYNTERCLDLLPQIRYLTRSEKETAVSQFPFDLFLRAAPWENKDGCCWFLEQMSRALEQDLWQHSYGCRLEGIRVRLHSNIYLSCFYEAELLFHNVGIIYRFAYLISRELLKDISRKEKKSRKPLVIVGYEFYSSVLIEQIAQMLTQKGRKAYYVICANSQENERIHLSPELKSMESDKREKMLKQAEYVVVLPVGTTLSTLYRIMGEICAHWEDAQFPYENYILVLVREKETNLSKRYWHLNHDHVILQPQSSKGSETCCRYLLLPQARWSEMHYDEEKEEVLVYVDETSTKPKEIFVLKDARFRGISHFLTDPVENDRRMSLLKGLVHYGHIVEGNNHFQFYLDMERYFFRAQQAERGRKTVNKWLQTLRGKIDPNAYNIIVSPLHREDSPFAKAVIDQVFEHSLRFLHMDFEDTYREDARAKFSYIADEYREIRRFNRERPVNIYFINTAITSGTTLLRAKNLMTMLMEEAGVAYDRDSVFKGCFVLINRSAYDTLNSYVRFPEECFWAYLQLAVPSFNSRQNRCPTCKLTERYNALEYSSATNELGQEFRRLRIKHKKRTLAEFQSWIADTVMYSAGYAGWLRQWLYNYACGEQLSDDDYQVGIFTVDKETHTNLMALYCLMKWGIEKYLSERNLNSTNYKGECDAFMDAIQSFTLSDLNRLIWTGTTYDTGAYEAAKRRVSCLKPEYWKQVLINFVCAQKNYIRMVSIHQSYVKMDEIADQLLPGIPERGQQTAEVLANLMKSQVEGVKMIPLKAEWLISYIKVLSRPHLAQYHHIRQGILTIMLQLTAYGIGASESLPDYLAFATPFLRKKEDEDKVNEAIRGQVLQTLLKRLAGLQSIYFLRRDKMERIVGAFDCLRKDFLQEEGADFWEYRCFNLVPTSAQVEQYMVKLVKWASSYGDDENGCYLIEESFRHLEEGDRNE